MLFQIVRNMQKSEELVKEEMAASHAFPLSLQRQKRFDTIESFLADSLHLRQVLHGRE